MRNGFTLVSRCAGEPASAYRIRFSTVLAEFEESHKQIKDTPLADGVLLVAIGGERIYLSYRDL